MSGLRPDSVEISVSYLNETVTRIIENYDTNVSGLHVSVDRAVKDKAVLVIDY
ncbi:hypothetical protein K9M79_08510 [Candidatus Woesearchaeota archaeon]|nr:hypothetical protein [Candidatus Woesearchaeota archaeon]